MGFLFGSPGDKYSKEEKQLSEFDIKRMVSQTDVRTLAAGEVELVERTIIDKRRGDGKISLRQIYEALAGLKNNNKISQYDRDGLMRVFVEYFSK
ncbi:MAG: hypothetical protein WC862_00640 [Patescibacteria group bacterium]